VDYCPSVKPGDERYGAVEVLLAKSGCFEENKLLTECLTEYRKNFAKCKVFPRICRRKVRLWLAASKGRRKSDLYDMWISVSNKNVCLIKEFGGWIIYVYNGVQEGAELPDLCG
jgi:hypothetical protein